MEMLEAMEAGRQGTSPPRADGGQVAPQDLATLLSALIPDPADAAAAAAAATLTAQLAQRAGSAVKHIAYRPVGLSLGVIARG
eukprot:gene40642-6064_t